MSELQRRSLPAARIVATAALLLGTALAGCTLGPRYLEPPVPLPPSFSEADPQSYDSGHVPASALWHSFGDPALDRLIELALGQNTTLDQARAQVNEARALRGLESFALLPKVTASASRSTSKPSSLDPFIPPGIAKTTTFQAGFDASWEIDLFGGALSARRALRAQEQAAEASLEAARQSVVAEVAQAYFSLRADQERLRVETRNVANLGENQSLLEARLAAGRGSDLDVQRSRALQLGASARLPQTEAAITRDEQRLAVLTVQPLAELRAVLGAPRPLPPMPALVAVGTPEDWLRRRPDVRAAERRLAAATAEIGVDAAQFLPTLTLLGGFGWTAQAAKDIGKSAAQRWNYGPSLSWSFLDIGRVRQQWLASRARAAGAVALYRETALRALEETENGLAGYRAANRGAITLAEAATAAQAATGLARARFEAGAADVLTVLDAERSQLDLEEQLATAESQRVTALAALYKALAGDFAAPP